MFSKSRQKGDFGEGIATMFLMKHGFLIIGRNYLRKCGEIDIICKKEGIIHFIEVKSVSCEIFEIGKPHIYRPEENFSARKIARLQRAIGLFLVEHTSTDQEWQIDLITVYVSERERIGRVFFFPNASF